MKINKEQFAAICYLVIMDHHGDGYSRAHPDYIESKLSILDRGYDAYCALDRENQRRVMHHIELWGYELPEEIKNYERERREGAIKSLEALMGRK